MEINLLKYNRHWEKGYFYPYPKKRNVFHLLLAHLAKRQIIEITGLRRVGKSTLIFQIINYLKEKKLDSYRLLYFTFDEIQPTIESLLAAYTIQTGIDFKKEKIYVFLDEIQKLTNFQNQLKVYYDLYPSIKFVISGSTSLFLKKKSQESLVGRTFPFTINPLSFDEFLKFREKEEILQKPQLYQHELEKELELFLRSQFIESIKFSTMLEKKEYFSTIVRKIIFEDLPSIFKFDHPQIIFRLAQYIAQKPGGILNNLKLAQELQISNKTVSLYLYYLEESLLIKKYYNFSRNLISSEKRLKKYYLTSPSLAWALVDFSKSAELFENLLASFIKPSYFYRDSYGHEVDFVFTNDREEIFPTEVKYKKDIESSDLKNLLLFLKKYCLPQGYIFYRGVKRKYLTKNHKRIQLIPFFQPLPFNP